MNTPKITPRTADLLSGSAVMPHINPAVSVSMQHQQGIKRDDPLKPQKVAILGTAPSSRMLAPFADPAWTIWGSSPGNGGDPGSRPDALPRLPDAWIEMHANFLWPEYRFVYGEQYVKWLNEKTFPLLAPIDRESSKAMFPRAQLFPWRMLVKEFGHDFFTSTFAWMMAYAIFVGAKEIALYGVDMSSKDEYILQRPGGKFFKYIAEKRGIKVTIPAESDLAQPTPLYGIFESTPMGRKLSERKREVTGRIQGCDQRIGQANAEKTYLQGALENIDYDINVWGSLAVGDIDRGE